MSQNVYGIDIGTSNLKIFNGQTKTIINEKNIIAIRNKKDVFAIGNGAFEMYEKAPDNIVVSFPIKDGVIADIKNMKSLIEKMFIKLKPIADAVGLGIDIDSAKGNMIVNIGADTTEITVTSLGGIVISRIVKIGGNKLDEIICNIVKRKYNIMIGMKTAEQIKINLANAIYDEESDVRNPGESVVRGISKIISDSKYRKLLYTPSENKY